MGRRQRYSTSILSSSIVDQASVDAVSLELGAEAAAAAPPSRRLVVTGTESAGKTTLIRQLRLMMDGEISEDECRKFTREVRKAALSAVQELALLLLAEIAIEDAEPTAAHDALEQVLKLKPREMTSSRATESFSVVLEAVAASSAVERVENLQRRQSCAHFAQRLLEMCKAEFVPEQEDLLHVSVPTSGEQETRLQFMEGGELGVVEMSARRFLTAYASEEVSSPSLGSGYQVPTVSPLLCMHCPACAAVCPSACVRRPS